ncbi:MAG: energy-coupling factor ABC transporter permease [Oleiphilaceae bacterium]|nr:energy-coupling factor ABC transporter permease [Oleiphilaceae bacterium]
MNLSADLFGAGWYWTFNLLFAALLLLSLFFIHWQALLRDTGLQHRLGMALVAVVCIWSIRAGISEGLGIHFFLITSIHLIFGWQLAIWVIALALLGMVWIGREVWQGIGINAFVSAIVPMLCTYTLWRIQQAKQLYNPFAFIFIVCFMGAIVSVIASGILLTWLLWASGAYPFEDIVEQFWIYVPLIALPEATINGIIITALVVYRPQWVRFFEQEKYR